MCLTGIYAYDMTGSRYAKNAGAVFTRKYYLVRCPKYRRPVLASPVDKRLQALSLRTLTESTR